MELLELIDGLTSTQDMSGVDLYFGLYRNKLRIPFTSIGRVRYHNTPEKFSARLSYINPIFHSRSTFKSTLTVTDYISREGGNVEDLLKFINWRNNVAGVKIVLNIHNVTLYFNEINSLHNFNEIFPEKIKYSSLFYRIKIPNFERGVIYQKNPQHKWRIYLRAYGVDDNNEFWTTLQHYNFYPCPTIKFNIAKNIRLKNSYCWTYDNNFIDCDDDGLITVFALKYPNIVKKVCRIESR